LKRLCLTFLATTLGAAARPAAVRSRHAASADARGSGQRLQRLRERMRAASNAPDVNVTLTADRRQICLDQDLLVEADVRDSRGMPAEGVRTEAWFLGEKLAGSGTIVVRPTPQYVDWKLGKFRTLAAEDGDLSARYEDPILEVRAIDMAGPGGGSSVLGTRTLPISIKACDAPSRALAVRCEEAGDVDRFRCSAQAPAGASPVRFEWDLGDGRIERTAASDALVSYSERSRPDLLSSYVVGVHATLADGAVLQGRASVEMYNTSMFAALHNGSYALRVVFDGYPRLAGERFRSHVRIVNDFPEPIALRSAEERWYPCVPGELAEPAEPERRAVKLDALLGRSALAPGEAVEIDYAQPVSAFRDYCGVTVAVEGQGLATGLGAVASWRMPRPRLADR
jgi:hypothetical protein